MSKILKQAEDKPLFPDIDWEKPVNKKQKGDLLIVGGSPHGFASVANSYDYAIKAGVGTAMVLMPEATRQAIKGFLDDVNFLPSTISGSFSKKGLTQLIDYAKDAWATLLAGEFGRNSETASLIEGFLMRDTGKIILSKDTVDYATTSYPKQILFRKDTLIVASLSQLQKLLQRAGMHENVRFIMSVEQLSKFLSGLTSECESSIVTVHHNHVFVAVNGNISITSLGFEERLWQTHIAAYASVFWIQHPTKPFEAITTAVWDALHHE
jgi:hypothetical protein